jgi:hypothetical protein
MWATRSCLWPEVPRTSAVAGKDETPRLKPPQDSHAESGLCHMQVKSVW